MPTLTSQPLASDFIRHYWDQAYSFESVYLRNTGGSDIVVETAGVPVKVGSGDQYDVVVATDEANATHFVITRAKVTIPAGGKTQSKVTVVARGPVVIEKSGIPAKDYAGASYNVTALEARFAAMSPIAVVRDNSANLVASPRTT